MHELGRVVEVYIELIRFSKRSALAPVSLSVRVAIPLRQANKIKASISNACLLLLTQTDLEQAQQR